MTTPHARATTLDSIVAWFETLTRESVDDIDRIYAPDAFFKDPFNEVRGVPAIQHIFAHMFRSLERPRFVIHDSVAQGDQCFLSWNFRFAQRRGKAREMIIRGASHLRFADDGRIAMHRDYWDVAEELYEKLPLLGTLMRWLKRRVNA
jgi:ketosteroid isomerase-like protein